MTSGLEEDNPLKPRSQAASRCLCELHALLLMLPWRRRRYQGKESQRPGAKKWLPRAHYGVETASPTPPPKPHACRSDTQPSDITYTAFHLLSAFCQGGTRTQNPGNIWVCSSRYSLTTEGAAQLYGLIHKTIVKLGFS